MNYLIFKYDEMDGSSISNVSTDILTVEIDGEPWFVASDVCNLLGLTNPTESLSSLDEDERLTSVILRAGQNRKVNLISESGLRVENHLLRSSANGLLKLLFLQ